MKEDQRMNAKSPDPDDLAREELPESAVRDDLRTHQSENDRAARPSADRSAPHVPPLEKGRIRGE
jgi:hypothetical protein